MPCSVAPALVLFDIDGTLIRRAGPHHKQALTEAVRIVTGRECSLDGVATHGVLDGDLFRILLEPLCLSEAQIEQNLQVLTETAERCYLQRCPEDLTQNVCPGVRELLEGLATAGVAMALVSGNFSRIGWKKMELARLRHYFRSGTFAEQGQTRAELVRLAIEEARHGNWIASNAPISLVGDHPNDIRAARANSIRPVAACTGLSSLEELMEERPDILVKELSELAIERLL